MLCETQTLEIQLALFKKKKEKRKKVYLQFIFTMNSIDTIIFITITFKKKRINVIEN